MCCKASNGIQAHTSWQRPAAIEELGEAIRPWSGATQPRATFRDGHGRWELEPPLLPRAEALLWSLVCSVKRQAVLVPGDGDGDRASVVDVREENHRWGWTSAAAQTSTTL